VCCLTLSVCAAHVGAPGHSRLLLCKNPSTKFLWALEMLREDTGRVCEFISNIWRTTYKPDYVLIDRGGVLHQRHNEGALQVRHNLLSPPPPPPRMKLDIG
jgi:hypothetical protein